MITIVVHGARWSAALTDIEAAALATIRSTCDHAARLGEGKIFAQLAALVAQPDDGSVDFTAATLNDLNKVFAGFTALARGLHDYNLPRGAYLCRSISELCQRDALGRFDDRGRHQPYLN